ncbi:hypothetical protein HU200_059436 [Digitaria exilis]|uniref:RWP-RK domain-containing protein n=1 Tax=Digitaria exilis TaxID=1010633 RepID=A0A835ABW4_9POAL|nr:hypothetical protein HU200_059436 [Digitaria exilis]
MADGHGGEGTNDWEGPCDPLLMQDYFDDVYYLLDIPNIIDPPPPLAAQPPQTATAGYSGDNRPSTSNNAAVDVNVTVPTPPTHIAQVATDPPCASRTQDVVGSSACTSSATASTSAAAAAMHKNALDCTGCHVLREVVHSNGFGEATRLCVHGAAGVFYHATLEVYHVNSEGLATAMTHQSYIDFRGRDYLWVKHYLADYAQQRASGGYTVIRDSISAFHDALCSGMNYGGKAAADGRRGGEMEAAVVENGGGSSRPQQQELAGAAPTIIDQGHAAAAAAAAAGPSSIPSDNNEQERQEVVRQPVGRSALAIQRERASNLKLADLARYFHLPMAEAATHLGVCATVLKSTSRKFHIARWPHRKIKSINTHIAKLREKGGNDGMREMERLIEARRKIYAKLLGHQ